MAEISYLLSTLLMGLFLVVTVLALSRGRGKQRDSPAESGRYSAEAAAEGGGAHLLPGETIAVRIARTPAAWSIGFFLLALGLGAIAVLSIEGTASAGTALLVTLAALVAVYLLSGIYLAAKQRGRPSSLAAAEGLGTLGLILIVVIMAKLVTGG